MSFLLRLFLWVLLLLVLLFGITMPLIMVMTVTVMMATMMVAVVMLLWMMMSLFLFTCLALTLLTRYEEGEVCQICGHCPASSNEQQGQQESAFPSEILPGFLFLGSYDNASRAELLKALGISHIVNVRNNINKQLQQQTKTNEPMSTATG